MPCLVISLKCYKKLITIINHRIGTEACYGSKLYHLWGDPRLFSLHDYNQSGTWVVDPLPFYLLGLANAANNFKVFVDCENMNLNGLRITYVTLLLIEHFLTPLLLEK